MCPQEAPNALKAVLGEGSTHGVHPGLPSLPTMPWLDPQQPPRSPRAAGPSWGQCWGPWQSGCIAFPGRIPRVLGKRCEEWRNPGASSWTLGTAGPLFWGPGGAFLVCCLEILCWVMSLASGQPGAEHGTLAFRVCWLIGRQLQRVVGAPLAVLRSWFCLGCPCCPEHGTY
jgi:hypothetical protein